MLKSLNCPNCNNSVKIEISNRLSHCPFCGSSLYFDRNETVTEINKHYYDEAKLESLRMQREEIEYQREQDRLEAENLEKFYSEKNAQFKKNMKVEGILIFISCVIDLIAYLILRNKYSESRDTMIFTAAIAEIGFIVATYFLIVAREIVNRLYYVCVGFFVTICVIAYWIIALPDHEEKKQQTLSLQKELDNINKQEYKSDNVLFAGWLNDNLEIGEKGVVIEKEKDYIQVTVDAKCIKNIRDERDEILDDNLKWFCSWEYESGEIIFGEINQGLSSDGNVTEIKNYNSFDVLLNMEAGDEKIVYFYIDSGNLDCKYSLFTSKDLRIAAKLKYVMDDGDKTRYTIE